VSMRKVVWRGGGALTTVVVVAEEVRVVASVVVVRKVEVIVEVEAVRVKVLAMERMVEAARVVVPFWWHLGNVRQPHALKMESAGYCSRRGASASPRCRRYLKLVDCSGGEILLVAVDTMVVSYDIA